MKQKQQGNKSYGWPIILIIGFMCLIAMGDALKGVFIPVFKDVFKVENTAMGFLLTISSMGYIIGTYTSGHLCDKYGQKKIIISGGSMMMLSIPIIILGNSYPMLLVGLFVMNFGSAFIALGINTLIPLIMVSFQSVLMNIVHGAYGFGSAFTQSQAGALIYKGISWSNIYMYMGIFAMFLILMSFVIKIPTVEKIKVTKKVPRKELFKRPLLYAYILCLGFYVCAEMATGNWFINYLKEAFLFNEKSSAFYSSMFFAGLTVGRLLGGFFTEKFGYLKTISFCLGMNVILFPIGMFFKADGAYLISLTGVFCSIVFPTIILTVRYVFEDLQTYATGIIVTLVSCMAMLGNMMIGYINDKINVEIGFAFIGIFFTLSFLTSVYMNYKIGNKIEIARKS